MADDTTTDAPVDDAAETEPVEVDEAREELLGRFAPRLGGQADVGVQARQHL